MQLLRDLAQLRILADDARRAAALGELLLEQHVVDRHAALGDRSLDEQQQMIGIHRLGEEIHRAFLHRRHRVLDAAVGRHHDDRQLRIELLGRAQHAEAVAVGQLQVGQHDGRPCLLQLLYGRRLVHGLDDRVPLLLERVAQHRPQRIFVFDEKDGRGSQC